MKKISIYQIIIVGYRNVPKKGTPTESSDFSPVDPNVLSCSKFFYTKEEALVFYNILSTFKPFNKSDRFHIILLGYKEDEHRIIISDSEKILKDDVLKYQTYM